MQHVFSPYQRVRIQEDEEEETKEKKNNEIKLKQLQTYLTETLFSPSSLFSFLFVKDIG